jgi:cytidylate kinase
VNGATMDRFIIAVDGPAGAGKGSICRAVAGQFGLAYLDTGAVYRALAVQSLRVWPPSDGTHTPGWQPQEADVARLATMATTMPFVFRRLEQGDYGAFLGPEEVTTRLREEQVGERASLLSALPEVRAALLAFQRQYGGTQDTIFDGRDIGTVVWPEAPLKIFLTASLEARARRRALELQQRGETANLAEIGHRMAERDRRDAERAHAPLAVAADAVVIDTTHLTLEQSTTRVMREVACRIAAGRGHGA